jgi:hypothetical protein
MEWIVPAITLPITWLVGLKHSRLKIPWVLLGAIPAGIYAVGRGTELSPTSVIASCVSSLVGMYLGAKTRMVGLTGGIACGKSTLVDILNEEYSNDVAVID